MRKFLVISGILFGLLLLTAGIVYLAAFGDNTQEFAGERSLYIPPNASFESVTDSLEKRGIVQNPRTFARVGRVTGWGDQVKAGHYLIASGQSNVDILQTIRKGLRSPVQLTIPPGTVPERVANAVANQMYIEAGEFLAALKDPDLAASLGTDTLHLFGYMLPETYEVYWLNDAPTIVSKIKQEFDSFFTDEMKQGAAEQNLTVDEVLRMASIVEWETNHVPEKPTIAGVYLNRLHNRWRLQADPTVQFALLEIEGARRRLFNRDYDIVHPYNTYRVFGLPPGPLTNPSPSSIQAVVDPEEHDYYFFVAHGDGSHTFTRTYAEHRAESRKFHALMRERRRQAAAQNQADGS